MMNIARKQSIESSISEWLLLYANKSQFIHRNCLKIEGMIRVDIPFADGGHLCNLINNSIDTLVENGDLIDLGPALIKAES